VTTRTPILPPGPIVEMDATDNRAPIVPMGYYPPTFRRFLRAALAAAAVFAALAIGLTTATVVLAARAGEPTAQRP
jgi:hypothetical protein